MDVQARKARAQEIGSRLRRLISEAGELAEELDRISSDHSQKAVCAAAGMSAAELAEVVERTRHWTRAESWGGAA